VPFIGLPMPANSISSERRRAGFPTAASKTLSAAQGPRGLLVFVSIACFVHRHAELRRKHGSNGTGCGETSAQRILLNNLVKRIRRTGLACIFVGGAGVRCLQQRTAPLTGAVLVLHNAVRLPSCTGDGTSFGLISRRDPARRMPNSVGGTTTQRYSISNLLPTRNRKCVRTLLSWRVAAEPVRDDEVPRASRNYEAVTARNARAIVTRPPSNGDTTPNLPPPIG
jgi:hypothetical protein